MNNHFGQKKVGKIIKYNGRYGFIKSVDSIADFERDDLHGNIENGDYVIYREEYRGYTILARNISLLKKQKTSDK